MIGTTLGHFHITARLGAGGMGEVYRARDERLDREVAVKVLPGDVAHDPERLARFEREAKALARLSHPNILAIHEFGDDAGVRFVVTELLAGEALRSRIGRGPLPWRSAVDIAASIADGLAAAHAQGIVHRDLKPENVFLTSDGWVKLLDFGLARFQEGAPGEQETLLATRPGTVLGTAGYMSPEQVRAESSDQRSDIFALGCILYEMLSGERAFPGKSGPEVLSAILTKTPRSLVEHDRGLPQPLSGIVERCLEKVSEQRFQSAGDLAFAVRSLLGPVTAAEVEKSRGTDVGPDARPSVAVLPFANLSADPEQEFFCDGMAEEIINALAHIHGLRVVARTSAFAFKGRNEDIRQIGRSLDVGAIVEGSVRKAGDRLRITVQLIDVRDGSHLWSERFDRRLEDVFEIQDEISLAIVEKLEVELLGSERAVVVKRHTENVDAYNAYLQGLHHWNALTPEGYARSRACFEEAIRIDPSYAKAYAWLAIWYQSQSWWAALRGRDAMAAALPLAERALRLDETTHEAYELIGAARAFFECDWEAGEKSLLRAVALGPNAASARGNYGVFLLATRRFDEALAQVRLLQKLDPLSPTWSSWTYTWLACAGELGEGIAGLERVVSMHPHHWLPHHELAGVLSLAGRLEEARVESERAFELSGGLSRAAARLAALCHMLGDTARGDELFDVLQQRAGAAYVSPTLLSLVYLARGEPEAALERLRQAKDDHDPWLPFIRFEWGRNPPADPRFDALLEPMGI